MPDWGRSHGGSGSLYGVASGGVPPLQRRRLLTAAGLVAGSGLVTAVAGCAPRDGRDTASGTDSDTNSGTTADARADTGDDVALADRAAGASARLLAGYRATARRHPSLGRLLDPLAAHHAEHVDVFSVDRHPTARPDPVPRRERDAVAALQTAERRAVGERRTDVLAATSGDLARALASAAACQDQHLVLLDRARP